MKVSELMQARPRVCSPGNSLATAGRIMQEVGCGALPVVGDRIEVVGMLTDRDICCAVTARDRRPSEVRVREVMSEEVFTCLEEDDLASALVTMRERQVRRLPVVDGLGTLRGILCLDDVAVHYRVFDAPEFTGPLASDIAETLKAICRHPTLVPAV